MLPFTSKLALAEDPNLPTFNYGQFLFRKSSAGFFLLIIFWREIQHKLAFISHVLEIEVEQKIPVSNISGRRPKFLMKKFCRNSQYVSPILGEERDPNFSLRPVFFCVQGRKGNRKISPSRHMYKKLMDFS